MLLHLMAYKRVSFVVQVESLLRIIDVVPKMRRSPIINIHWIYIHKLLMSSEKKLTADELYAAFQSINDVRSCQKSPEVIFDSVREFFTAPDPLNQQNFLNMIVENYGFFSKIPDLFDKANALAKALFDSDHISCKVTSLTAMTKLWLQMPEDYNQGKFNEYIDFMFAKSNDSNEIPHIRNTCSQCILEIYNLRPSAIKIPIEKIMEAATNNHAQTAYSELAFAMGGKSQELSDFLEKRFWSMAPIESTVFTPPYKEQFPGIPNDPLLLHSALAAGDVPQDAVLSILNNPFSGYGVSSVILEFNNSFEFNGQNLFTTFDSPEMIAAKSGLLPRSITSIETNPVLMSFVDAAADSPFSAAVFSLAEKFNPDDIFTFFKKFYEKTPNQDPNWVTLYESQPKNVQISLRCFIAKFPSRRATAEILLKEGKAPLAVIDMFGSEYQSLLPNVVHNGGFQAALLAREKSTGVQTPVKNMECGYGQSPPLLDVTSSSVETDDGITKVTVIVRPPVPLAKPLFGARFRMSDGGIFAEDSFVTLPSVFGEATLVFEAKAIKFATGSPRLVCEYTDSDGQAQWFPMGEVVVDAHDLLSPSSVDFKSAWAAGEESRLLLREPFASVITRLNATVFGRRCEREDGRLQVVLSTPGGAVVALAAVSAGDATVLHFRAPSSEFLAYLDSFLRSL